MKKLTQFGLFLVLLSACAREPVPVSVANGTWVTYATYSEWGKPGDCDTPVNPLDGCFYVLEDGKFSLLSSVGFPLTVRTTSWKEQNFDWDGDYVAAELIFFDHGYGSKKVRLGEDNNTIHFDTGVMGCPNYQVSGISLRRVSDEEALGIQARAQESVHQDLLQAKWIHSLESDQTVIFKKDIPLDQRVDYREDHGSIWFIFPIHQGYTDYSRPFAQVGNFKFSGVPQTKESFQPVTIPKGLVARVVDERTLESSVPGFEKLELVIDSFEPNEFFSLHKAGYYHYLKETF